MTVVSGDTFQIDDVNKQIWDRDVVPTFEEDAAPIDPSDVLSINYLFGKVTFVTPKTGAITVSGTYMPVVEVAGSNSYTVNMNSAILDDTNFKDANSNGGFRTRVPGLNDVSVSLSRWYDLVKTFITPWLSRSVVLIDITLGGGTDGIRGWFKIESLPLAGDISALESEELSFQLDGDVNSSFGWESI